MSKTKINDMCQVQCFNPDLVTQIRETFPPEDTLGEREISGEMTDVLRNSWCKERFIM